MLQIILWTRQHFITVTAHNMHWLPFHTVHQSIYSSVHSLKHNQKLSKFQSSNRSSLCFIICTLQFSFSACQYQIFPHLNFSFRGPTSLSSVKCYTYEVSFSLLFLPQRNSNRYFKVKLCIGMCFFTCVCVCVWERERERVSEWVVTFIYKSYL